MPGDFHHTVLGSSETHISHNALVKTDPMLYWKCPAPFPIQIKHGICRLPTPQGLIFLRCTEKTCLPPSTTAQPSHNALEIQDARNITSLSCVPQDTDFTLWGGKKCDSHNAARLAHPTIRGDALSPTMNFPLHSC